MQALPSCPYSPAIAGHLATLFSTSFLKSCAPATFSCHAARCSAFLCCTLYPLSLLCMLHFLFMSLFLAFHLHFLMNRREHCRLLAVCIFSFTFGLHIQAGASTITPTYVIHPIIGSQVFVAHLLLAANSLHLFAYPLCAVNFVFIAYCFCFYYCIGCCTNNFFASAFDVFYLVPRPMCVSLPFANFFARFCCKRCTSLITVLLISQHLKICFAVRCFCCNNIFSSVFGDQ